MEQSTFPFNFENSICSDFFNYTYRLKKLFMFCNVLEITHHMPWGPSMIHVLLVANIIF